MLVLQFYLSGNLLGAEPIDRSKGTVMLVGDILGYNERDSWKKIVEIAGGEHSDIVVVPTANDRSKLYGSYAVKALERYSPFVELLPLSIDSKQFSMSYQQAITDPEILEHVQQAEAVFFVGGSPQRISQVLFSKDGSETLLAREIRRFFTEGGLVVGGIPGATVISSGLDAISVLEQGGLKKTLLHRGLDLINPGWYVDQSIFSAGRFSEVIVAMHQLGIHHGIGVGVNTMAILQNDSLEVVVGDDVIILDLSNSKGGQTLHGIELQNIQISFLGQGDRMDLETLQVTPSEDKLRGFEIDPGSPEHESLIVDMPEVSDMFSEDKLSQLILQALDGQTGQAIGLTKPSDTRKRGFEFRLYRGKETRGWLSAEHGLDRFTVLNIALDIKPIVSPVIRIGQ